MLDQAVEVLSHVNGVRGIEKLTVVSAKQKSQDRQVARRLQQLMEGQFPQQNVKVSFFGSVAVLSGVVPALPFKRAAERAILQDPDVSRVVNKIEVGR